MAWCHRRLASSTTLIWEPQISDISSVTLMQWPLLWMMSDNQLLFIYCVFCRISQLKYPFQVATDIRINLILKQVFHYGHKQHYLCVNTVWPLAWIELYHKSFLQFQRPLSFILWTPTNLKVSECACLYRLVYDHPLNTGAVDDSPWFPFTVSSIHLLQKGLFHNSQCFVLGEGGWLSLAMSMVSTAHFKSLI